MSKKRIWSWGNFVFDKLPKGDYSIDVKWYHSYYKPAGDKNSFTVTTYAATTGINILDKNSLYTRKMQEAETNNPTAIMTKTDICESINGKYYIDSDSKNMILEVKKPTK